MYIYNLFYFSFISTLFQKTQAFFIILGLFNNDNTETDYQHLCDLLYNKVSFENNIISYHPALLSIV